MEKFRKKPILIEAVQLTIDNIYEVQEWANSTLPDHNKITISFLEEEDLNWRPAGLNVPSMDGVKLCCFGDYLIRGISEYSIMQAHAFELSFEPLN